MRRKLFACLSAGSLLLCAVTVLLAAFSFRQDLSYPFSWRGGKCELGAGGGRVRMSNRPRIMAEDRERAQALAELKRGFGLVFDASHATLQNARYGSPEYVAAKEGRDKLQSDYEIRRTLIESTPRSAVVEYSLPLWLILAALVPWPVVWIVYWVRRRPRLGREMLKPAGLVGLSMVSLSAIVAIAWVWSYFGGDAWAFKPRSIPPPIVDRRAQSWQLFSWIRLSRGQIQFISKEIPLIPSQLGEVHLGYKHGEGLIPAGPFPLPGGVKPPVERRWAMPGVTFATRVTATDGRVRYFGYQSLVVSVWAPWLICTLFPAGWTWVVMQRLRLRRGYRCRACGYRLQGNTSGVCPECGSSVARKEEFGNEPAGNSSK